jgi:hypothetical protein
MRKSKSRPSANKLKLPYNPASNSNSNPPPPFTKIPITTSLKAGGFLLPCLLPPAVFDKDLDPSTLTIRSGLCTAESFVHYRVKRAAYTHCDRPHLLLRFESNGSTGTGGRHFFQTERNQMSLANSFETLIVRTLK